ncbi:MAG: hypothetical protein WC444_06840 [Candidatus Paceibacterota bacterium]
MTRGGLGGNDQYHIVNFHEEEGDSTSVDATNSMVVFVAPCACEIIDMGLSVTTAIAAHADNHWTIQVANTTQSNNLLSTAFNTDSDNTGNGGRALTAAGLDSLCDNGSGTNYLQYAVLAKGDVLTLTATKAASATALANPQIVIRYRP